MLRPAHDDADDPFAGRFGTAAEAAGAQSGIVGKQADGETLRPDFGKLFVLEEQMTEHASPTGVKEIQASGDISDVLTRLQSVWTGLCRVRDRFPRAAEETWSAFSSAGSDPPYWTCGVIDAHLHDAAESCWKALMHLHDLQRALAKIEAVGNLGKETAGRSL